MPFQKGQSGNPGGRRKTPEDVKEWGRAVFTETGRQALEDEIHGRGPYWFKAVELAIAYGFGKPTQPMGGDDQAAPLEVIIRRG